MFSSDLLFVLFNVWPFHDILCFHFSYKYPLSLQFIIGCMKYLLKSHPSEVERICKIIYRLFTNDLVLRLIIINRLLQFLYKLSSFVLWLRYCGLIILMEFQRWILGSSIPVLSFWCDQSERRTRSSGVGFGDLGVYLWDFMTDGPFRL